MRRSGRSSARGEGGVATVVSLGLVALLLLVTGGSAGAVGLVVGQRRAQAAADLASLAAAQAIQAGGDACAAAGRIAGRHRVHLVGCAIDGSVVVATVELDLPRAFAGRTLRARARAGPGPPV